MSLAAILEAPAKIADAIKKASQTTGADFDYLLKTAARESSFKSQAQAKTSSAAGLFQFIESTWLKMVKEQGHEFGLGRLAAEIVETDGGRCYVPNAGARKEILGLRHNPELSAMMAGAFTRQNADFLSDRLGRAPTEGELYIAHFLGAPQGARLVQLAESQPDMRADTHFANAARANRSIFYAGGKPKTMAQVYDSLVSTFCETPASVATGVAAAKVPASRPGNPAMPATPLPATPLQSTPLQSTPLPASGFVPTKAPAMAEKTLEIASGRSADAGIGSAGFWQTIVLPGPQKSPAALDGDDRSRRDLAQAAERLALDQGGATAARPTYGAVPGAAGHGRVTLDSSSFSFFSDDFWQRLSSG